LHVQRARPGSDIRTSVTVLPVSSIAPALTILFLAPSQRNRLAGGAALFFNVLVFVAMAFVLYRALGQTGELGSPLLLVLMLVLIVIPLISGLSIGAHWPVARSRNLEQVGRK
jgi:hypothetical protein